MFLIFCQAASLAERSLCAAFPSPEKRRNAILFCQAEILSVISDNLTSPTATAVVDAKAGDPEETESKLSRLLVTSLVSYSNFIDDVSQDDAAKFEEYLSKNRDLHHQLLSNSMFWKLASHKSPAVRTAWFTVARCLAQKLLAHRDVFDAKLESKLASHILGKLDESDAGVASLVWESSLHLTQNSPGWSEAVNVEKQVRFFSNSFKISSVLCLLLENEHSSKIESQSIFFHPRNDRN